MMMTILIIFNIGVGHTAWAPEGREGRSQAGPKGQKPARRAAD